MLDLEHLLFWDLHVQDIIHDVMVVLTPGWWMPWVAEVDVALDGV